MNNNLNDVIASDNNRAKDRALYAISVKENIAAGTLTDIDHAMDLLNEMKDESKLDELEIPAEIKTKLIAGINEIISSC